MSSYEQQRAAALGRQALDTLDGIAAQGRSPTPSERAHVDELLSLADQYQRGGKGLSQSQGWDGRFNSASRSRREDMAGQAAART